LHYDRLHAMDSSMNWEILARLPQAVVRRHGRYLVADLGAPHRTISTSPRNGGQTEQVLHLVNHQGCEGTAHEARFEFITGRGEEAYHGSVCAEIDLPPERTAIMQTAANMNYAAIVARRHDDVEVLAVVTAGVETNATCAGDPADWHETPEGITKLPAGTINTMLLINVPVTSAALARTVVTMTEGKTAAVRRLAAPSRYSAELATGTGTDQFCVAAPIEGRKPIASASPHMKFGELIGLAVRDATLEALRWQNGLEPSITRGFFHALGRFGLKEDAVLEGLAGLLSASDLALLKKNSKSVFYEPLVGAAAHAIAAVLDRSRYGTLPPSCARDALVQQAATLATSLAAKPDHWPQFRAHLHATQAEPTGLVIAAIALGWSEKWRPT
jgi:adenosylcobinamide amidohydrolase